MNINEKALLAHKNWQGKIEVISRASIKSREDLSVAYTPGVAAPCLEIHKDKELSYEYTRKKNLVAVITDGSAVLGLGDIGGDGQVCRTLRLLGPPFAPLLQNGIFQQFQIHIITHAHHVTGLFCTQQIAGTTDLQVTHGDLKAGAKLGKVADGSQTLLSDLC